MDPISYVFAAYLDSVQTNVQNKLSDTMNANVTAMIVEYEGVNVPFQHQLWRIKPESVCNTYRDDLTPYSACTVKAKAMFMDLCNTLSKREAEHWRYAKLKNMYCNAAIAYKPTVAQISAAPKDVPIDVARKKCNTAIAAAMGNNDQTLAQRRETLCGDYEKLKNN